MKKIVFFTAILAFSHAHAYHSKEAAEMADVFQALFMAQEGLNVQAAKQFADVAHKLQDHRLMREAYRTILRGNKNHQQALVYAQQWHELGGGPPALLAQAHLLLVLQQNQNAEMLLYELKNTHDYQDDDIYQLLRYGQNTLGIASRIFGNDASGRLFLAKVAISQQQWEQAQQAISQGLNDDPMLYELRFAQMQLAQFQQDSPLAAIPLIDDFIRQKCPGLDAPCQEANVVYAYRLYFRNNENWKDAFNDDAHNDAALAAGQFFEIAIMPSRALTHYEKIQGEVFQADLGRARIARDSNRLQDAIQILNDTPVSNEREFALREITVSDLIRTSQGDSAALDRIRKAYDVAPENDEILYHYAITSEDAGDVDTAIILLERLTKLSPDSASGWNALGYLLADHNMRLQEAEEFIKKALELNPESPNIIDSLGWVYYRQGKLNEALKYLSMAADRSSSAEIAAHLGEVHWMLGDFQKARDVFNKGRLHEPDNKVLNETVKRLQVAE